MKPFAILVLAVVACAQQPENKVVLHGTVVSITGEPVKKAEVTLQPSDGRSSPVYSIASDAKGQFSFANLDSGRYMVTALRAGYVGDEMPRRSKRPGTYIAISPGQEPLSLTLRLTPQGKVVGRVLDEDGDPLANAYVQLVGFRYIRGKRQLTPLGAERTDELGEYRLSGIVPGRYYIVASYQSRPLVFDTRIAA